MAASEHLDTRLNPALAKDVCVDTDRYSKYLYYAACDEDAVMLTGEKQLPLVSLDQGENVCMEGVRIRESDSAVIHAVSVSFHNGNLAHIQSIIDDERSDRYVNFNVMREQLELDDKSIDQFMKLTPHLSKIKLQLGNDEDWAAIVVFTNKEIKAKFHFLQVTGNRVIEVITLCRSLDMNIGDVITPWNELVAKYKDMPMNVFTEANH